MKPDKNYVYQILTAVGDPPEESTDPIDPKTLMQAINADPGNQNDIETFYLHMRRIKQAKLIMCTDKNFGFKFTDDGWGLVDDARYELTWEGTNALEKLQKNTPLSKVKRESLLTLRDLAIGVIAGIISGVIVLFIGFIWFMTTQ